jgi:hypothetical protein
MTSIITDFRTRVRLLLRDSAATPVTFTDAVIDDAIRHALEEISNNIPNINESTITLATAGREIALTGLVVLNVTEVWWPYVTTPEKWPPNRVAGFRLIFKNAVPYLFLSSLDGSQPQSGDKVRVWYASLHTISGLAGAAATTLPVELEELLVFGAAGFAAISQLWDRSEILNPDPIFKWGDGQLQIFHQRLELRRSQHVRSEGEPWSSPWTLDKWDNNE